VIDLGQMEKTDSYAGTRRRGYGLCKALPECGQPGAPLQAAEVSAWKAGRVWREGAFDAYFACLGDRDRGGFGIPA